MGGDGETNIPKAYGRRWSAAHGGGALTSTQPPRIGVGIIIRKENDVLLVKRKNVHGAGTWSTPGGHLDFGESPSACATCEAYEETGILYPTLG